MVRRNLLFVRAGPRSLHPRLIAADPRRNWDRCVGWYVDGDDRGVAEYYSAGGDNKFEGFEAWADQSGLADIEVMAVLLRRHAYAPDRRVGWRVLPIPRRALSEARG